MATKRSAVCGAILGPAGCGLASSATSIQPLGAHHCQSCTAAPVLSHLKSLVNLIVFDVPCYFHVISDAACPCTLSVTQCVSNKRYLQLTGAWHTYMSHGAPRLPTHITRPMLGNTTAASWADPCGGVSALDCSPVCLTSQQHRSPAGGRYAGQECRHAHTASRCLLGGSARLRMRITQRGLGL